MINSLILRSKFSELNLAHAFSLPILIEPSQFKLGDEFSYQFYNQISELCGTINLIPETQTLVLDYNGFCNLVSKSDIIINTLSSDFGVTKVSAMEQAQKFFFMTRILLFKSEESKGLFIKLVHIFNRQAVLD